MRRSIIFHLSYYPNDVHSSNDSWTMRVDEAVSQVNSNINIFSSAVRTFISQRSLTGLEVAIESKKGLYDRFRNESDNSIDSLRKKRESRIGTIQNEQDEQNLKFQRENNEKSKRKVEDSMFTIFDRAASPERKSKKEPANPTATDDASWKICNLLCLGCTVLFKIHAHHANNIICRWGWYPWLLVPVSAPETNGKHCNRGGKNY